MHYRDKTRINPKQSTRWTNISGKGDDKNSGTIDKPVYSLKRAKEVQGGDNEITMRFLDKASAIRCKKEADRG